MFCKKCSFVYKTINVKDKSNRQKIRAGDKHLQLMFIPCLFCRDSCFAVIDAPRQTT